MHALAETDDRELLARVRRGDAAAEHALYLAHAAPAVRRTRWSGVQQADAEDYVSEAFLRVLRQLRKGSGPDTHFRSYLLAAVRNVAADSRKGQPGREWATDVDDDAPSGAHDPADPQALVETRLLVRNAMNNLPPRWRDILWRLDVEGHKPATLALESGVSAQSIYALAYRARRALRIAYLAGERYGVAHAEPANDESSPRPSADSAR